MTFTPEQYDIINSSGNIKINAVAGSGKTTTVIAYAQTRPKDKKILYLAFNKSVKLDAIKKFDDKGLKNVTVNTAHSLAYQHIVSRGKYKVRHQGYNTSEIAELLNLQGNGEKHAENILANHINKFIAYFCNSDAEKVQDLNYLDIVFDDKARKFVTSFYDYIFKQTRMLLGMMDKGEIEITHDFYLKKFQLSSPNLGYDYILFDEGQDASPAMLDVFFKQKATKVIVGDTHQQIYGWRHAVNSLEKADFTTYHLSTSFRFSQNIADLAMGVLAFKDMLDCYTPVPITGKGNGKELKTKAILARTNLGLLLKAIEYVDEVENLYFEGNISSYTYADDGTSLYDVLNLYNGNYHLIKDKMIRTMKDIEELEEYIKKTEELQLGMMVGIVKKYGNEIPDIIKDIKAKHVGNDEKEKAELIFSTVHRCKGMEYDEIHLVDDFITEKKLEKLLEDERNDNNLPRINEEINLLYVAITRTKNLIYIPSTMVPEGITSTAQINIMQVESEEEEDDEEVDDDMEIDGVALREAISLMKEELKAYSVEKIREKHKDAYQPWSPELDDELTIMFCEGKTIKEMMAHFGRTNGAINARIKKLELKDLYG